MNYQRIFTGVLLFSLLLSPLGAAAATGSTNAKLQVAVKGLANDWRKQDGVTATLYDYATNARVTGLVAKKGKAEFKDLVRGSTYLLVIDGAGYETKEKILTLKKKTTKVSVKLVEAEETESLRIISPSQNQGVPILTIGQPVTVSVVVDSKRPGTVQAHLIHAVRGTRTLLGSARYTPPTDGSWKATTLTSLPLGAVSAGGGYQVTATFRSDDGATQLSATSAGLISVTNTRLTGPVISRFEGPSTLRVGQSGKWILEAQGSAGTPFCRVWWGHSPSVVTPQARGSSCKNDPLYPLTATYKVPGTYSVAAEITQSDGQKASKWLQVRVTQ